MGVSAVTRLASRVSMGVALMLVIAGGSASAATYYVAPAGNDASAGSQAAPWRTLQKAGDVAGAGDTVNVLPGTYQGFRPRKSGSASAPVRFIAQPGVVVTSPGASNSNNDNIWVRNVDYIVIDGFESTAAPRAGIAIQGEPDPNSAGIVIRNCHCHDNGRWGIFTAFTRELILEDNETSYSAIEHGIYVSNSGDRPIVRRNHAHHNNASGIQLNADPEQMGDDPNDPEGDGIIEDALIEANLIHDNGAAGGAAINLASVRSSLIRNNLLYANRSTGIAGWDDGYGDQFEPPVYAYGTRDNRILGNTIVQPSNGRFAIALKNGSVDNAVLDNILLHAGTRGSLEIDPESQPGLHSDYNIVVNVFSDDDNFFTLTQWRGFGFDAHSIISNATALFVDAAANDYRLKTTAAARDAGTALADLPTDREGTARPQGSAFDMGAHELAASGPSPTPTATVAPTLTRTATGSATSTTTRTATSTATRTSTATVTPTITQTVTPAPTVRVGGTLRYYRDARPVAAADVHLDGPSARSAASGAGGAFAFDGVPIGTWRLEPRKLGDWGTGISALDAAYVLQHVNGSRTLDATAALACDVTASGALSTLDATRILQLTVGILPQFAAASACASDWLFLPLPPSGATQTSVAPSFAGGVCQPGAIAYAPLGADALGQDFSAALLGDCTGNWQPAAAAANAPFGRSVSKPAAADATLTRLRRVRGGGLRATLLLRPGIALQAAEVVLNVDASRLRLRRARPALAARGALLQANQTDAGTLAIALAAVSPIAAGARTAIVLDFEPLTADARGAVLAVAALRLNE
ncbi:MAG: right-handed parallel beta-helix repeat-containing protein [Candidatus Binatia bacterium]